MQNGSWYNTEIYYQLRGQNFEDYLKKGRTNRYELLCAVDANYRTHALGIDYGISCGSRPFPNIPSIDALE